MLKRIACVLSLALLACGGLFAQEAPRSDVFVGYSYLRVKPQTSGIGGINMNGGLTSISWNFHENMGVIAEFGGYDGSKTIADTGTLNGQIYTYLFGPRFTYRTSEEGAKFNPFAQLLIGGAHASADLLDTSASLNSFAMSAGGGMDVKFTDHFSYRLGQVEYLFTRFNEGDSGNLNQHNVRYSTGFIFSF